MKLRSLSGLSVLSALQEPTVTNRDRDPNTPTMNMADFERARNELRQAQTEQLREAVRRLDGNAYPQVHLNNVPFNVAPPPPPAPEPPVVKKPEPKGEPTLGTAPEHFTLQDFCHVRFTHGAVAINTLTCCGMKEIFGLRRPEECVLSFAEYLYIYLAGRCATVLFSDTLIYRRGRDLAKFIKDNKLGTVVSSHPSVTRIQ